MRVTAHAFVAGQPGTYQEIYCQAPPQPGTGIVPGFPGERCGYPESAHTMTDAQQAAADDQQVAHLVSTIGGWPHERYGPAPTPQQYGRGVRPEPLVERRGRAQEAFWDAATPSVTRESVATIEAAANVAIETATRVRIAPEIEAAARAALRGTPHRGYLDPGATQAVIEAAFRAAGFEVEQ